MLVKTFDRTDDVSKLEGCNTRGIEYRWSIFKDALDAMQDNSRVLDFGAGSLRDSFELARRGYGVTAVDLDGDLLRAYEKGYDWPAGSLNIVAAPTLDESLAALRGKQFDLITCFDVLEHLENPVSTLETFRGLLSPNGKVLISVPNGSTLFELAFRADLILARAMKKQLRPGEPHLQRLSPKRWVSIINQAGLKVAQHDMQIGFFANTAFALVQLPTFLTARLLRKVGLNVDAQAFIDRVCTKARMERLNRVDMNTKKIFRPLFGWNLFVLTNRGAIPSAKVSP